MDRQVGIVNFQGVSEKAQSVTGSFVGKLLGSIAGILLIITVLKFTFYIVKVGQRGVLLRRGMPVLKQNGRLFYLLARCCRTVFILRPLGAACTKLGDWRRSRQVGTYKIKRPGIWMKFPGWYDVEKVNVQKRIQKIHEFIVDCPDGQHKFDMDLVTRVPCEADGLEFADYPARKIINSSESDDVFESFAGTTLVNVLECAEPAERASREWLLLSVNGLVDFELERVGYVLEGINPRGRALTAIGAAIKAFGPPTRPIHAVEDQEDLVSDDANVVQLPHPIATAVALGKELEESS